MIQVTPQMRILVALQPVDFRKGIDGMAQQCRVALARSPFSGTVFVFCNRKRTAIKILVYDGRGFWLCHKRLSQGRFPKWSHNNKHTCVQLEAYQLGVLMCAGDPFRTNVAPVWRPVNTSGGA